MGSDFIHIEIALCMWQCCVVLGVSLNVMLLCVICLLFCALYKQPCLSLTCKLPWLCIWSLCLYCPLHVYVYVHTIVGSVCTDVGSVCTDVGSVCTDVGSVCTDVGLLCVY